MPSRRYVERVSPSFRPCENGRPRPAKNEFVVHANLQSPPVHPNWGITYPRQMMKNLYRLTDWQIDSEREKYFESHYGLLSYKLTKNRNFDQFFKISGNIQIQLMCWRTDEDRSVANPSCHGHLFNLNDGLHFFVFFPSYQLSEWKEISEAILDVYHSWKL
ncbi:hypothetical protein [uncultured Thalassospira sp.]|uniref:hypothetical protein n=1 Tax=uncultured Thalassospira sp. TaxID=404382 RepID=UPI0030D7BEF9|tara:strand:+ start:2032 stop:2514 length:483 start_codon:yes stop_codon:yes gene_type:complete